MSCDFELSQIDSSIQCLEFRADHRHAYARGFKDFFERPARSYKQWLVMVDDWFAYVYDVVSATVLYVAVTEICHTMFSRFLTSHVLRFYSANFQACKRLPPSSVPPAYEWTHAYVRSCMDLWCGLEDVFDPPKGRWRRFDNRKLGQYHWKYHDLCYPFYTLDRRVRGGIRENWVTHKALPWPPTEEPEPNTQRKKTRTMRPIMRNARTWDGKVWRVKKTVETYVLYESELKRDKPVSPETQPPIVTALPTSSSTSSAATAPSDPPGVPAPLPAAVAPPPTARVRPVAPATTSAMRHAWYRDSLGGVSRSS